MQIKNEIFIPFFFVGAFPYRYSNYYSFGEFTPSSNGLFFKRQFSEEGKERDAAQVEAKTTAHYALPGNDDCFSCFCICQTL
jgi:hypothetical protein